MSFIINYPILDKSGSGGGGGSKDYNALENKPSINGVTLDGDKNSKELALLFLSETNEPSGPILSMDERDRGIYPTGVSILDGFKNISFEKNFVYFYTQPYSEVYAGWCYSEREQVLEPKTTYKYKVFADENIIYSSKGMFFKRSDDGVEGTLFFSSVCEGNLFYVLIRCDIFHRFSDLKILSGSVMKVGGSETVINKDSFVLINDEKDDSKPFVVLKGDGYDDYSFFYSLFGIYIDSPAIGKDYVTLKLSYIFQYR